ncbi:MAG: Co2+/Mg2+ efflux protein ApaG [Cycloclasticus sp.]
MSKKNPQNIEVNVDCTYIPSSSEPAAARYVFAYSISIQNNSETATQLLSRHWLITDANGKKQEVHGEGVVGEQPNIQPGETYQYTSGAVIETSVGAMQGSYDMLAADGETFSTTIPAFSLSIPRTLH